jgi:hypothetical protein
MADARHAKAHNNLTQHHKNVPMACEKIDGKHNAKKKKKRKKNQKKKMTRRKATTAMQEASDFVDAKPMQMTCTHKN